MIDLKDIPNSPGCYLYKDKLGNIIYVGKAKDLRKRVSSYFLKKDHDVKTQVLVSQIFNIDFIATNSEVEALILENNLIKKYSPKYNISLKDSKRYAYLELTGEEYPRLIIARSTKSVTKNGKLFGPFVSGVSRNEILDFLIKLFKIRTCRKMPKKECLRYHLKLCSAPCIFAVSKFEYDKSVTFVSEILNGKTRDVINTLKVLMNTYSKQKDFENALNTRNIIDSLNYLSEKQNMERAKVYDEDIINYVVKDSTVYLLLFSISKGILDRKQEFTFDFNHNFLEEFIVQYYSENNVPKELILPIDIDLSVKEFLCSKRASKVNIVVPKIGDKKVLLDLVMKNISLFFFSSEESLVSLKEILNLEKLPSVIECFDISHLSGSDTVASMVQFRNGKESKDNYRRFKIKTVTGIDDFSSIAEVVTRRYSRLILEKSVMPDLIIIDGGLGQLNFALSALNSLNLRIPIISVAKKEEDIYVPGSNNPLKIDKRSLGLKLIQRVRDEAHRFAISYNKLLRKKRLIEK